MSVAIKLYNGKVSMEYDPVHHAYKVDGRIVPSVTTITGVINKPALVPWAVNETTQRIQELWKPEKPYTAEQIRAAINDSKQARFRTSGEAMNIGTLAHDWIEQYIKSTIFGFEQRPMPDYQPVRVAVEQFLTWVDLYRVKFIASEVKVFSIENWYSGTLDIDLLLEVGNRRIIADLKTSKAIYPEYFLQCSAYAVAFSEENGVDYDSVMIIRLPKDSKDSIEIQERDDIDSLFNVFKSCLNIYNWQQGLQ